eukprot:gene5177-8783_t
MNRFYHQKESGKNNGKINDYRRKRRYNSVSPDKEVWKHEKNKKLNEIPTKYDESISEDSTQKRNEISTSSWKNNEDFGNWGKTDHDLKEKEKYQPLKIVQMSRTKYKSEREKEEEYDEKEEETVDDFSKFIENNEPNVIFVAFETKKEAEELLLTIDDFVDKSFIMKIKCEPKEEIELKMPPNEVVERIKTEVQTKYKDLLYEDDPIIRYVLVRNEIKDKLNELGYYFNE